MAIKRLFITIIGKIPFKKIAFQLAILAAIFIPLSAYLAYKNSSFILARMISHTTQTPVTIHAIDFHQNSFVIQNLTVGNPQKAYIPTAFRAEQVKVDAPYIEFLKKSITIDQIEMNNIYINIEFFTEDKIEGNWQEILENMEAEYHPSSVTKRGTHIKKLILNNIQVNLILSDGKIHRLSPIEHLEFDDVTSEQGLPTKEISEIIARKMVYTILKEDGLNLIIKIPLKVIKTILPFL
ncbi:MAG: hypothetical protein AB7N99_03065 [Simkaniaceae bacterium]